MSFSRLLCYEWILLRACAVDNICEINFWLPLKLWLIMFDIFCVKDNITYKLQMLKDITGGGNIFTVYKWSIYISCRYAQSQWRFLFFIITDLFNSSYHIWILFNWSMFYFHFLKLKQQHFCERIAFYSNKILLLQVLQTLKELIKHIQKKSSFFCKPTCLSGR